MERVPVLCSADCGLLRLCRSEMAEPGGGGTLAEVQRLEFRGSSLGHYRAAALTAVAVRPATGGYHVVTGSAAGDLTLWDRRHVAEPVSQSRAHENSIWEIRFGRCAAAHVFRCCCGRSCELSRGDSVDRH